NSQTTGDDLHGHRGEQAHPERGRQEVHRVVHVERRRRPERHRLLQGKRQKREDLARHLRVRKQGTETVLGASGAGAAEEIREYQGQRGPRLLLQKEEVGGQPSRAPARNGPPPHLTRTAPKPHRVRTRWGVCLCTSRSWHFHTPYSRPLRSVP